MRHVLRAWVLFPILAGPCDDGCEELEGVDVPVDGVVTIDGQPAQGVNLEARLSGSVLGTAVTDANGMYELDAVLNLDVSSSFEISVASYPTATYGNHVVFRPAKKVYDVDDIVDLSQPGVVNFEGFSSADISGHTLSNGNAVPGVQLELRGQSASTQTTTTGADGSYTFSAVPSGLYVVTPSPDQSIGLDWVPQNRALDLRGQDQTVDFNASFSPGGQITGRVTVGGQGLPNVRVDVTGPWPGHVMTNGTGAYIFGSVPAGNHTVAISGYDATLFTFNPTSKSAVVAIGQHPVVDFDGAVVVPNTPPTAAITSPTTSARFGTGASISFQGSGTDVEDGPLSGSAMVWTSNIDGQIGTGSSFSRSDLSEGSHQITLTVTDSEGLSSSASVSIDVIANQPPTVTIVTPTYDQAFYYGTAITFSANATDPEDGALTGPSVVWTSDQDGQIGTGATFTRALVGYSFHMITVTVTDSLGATASATIRIYVADPGE